MSSRQSFPDDENSMENSFSVASSCEDREDSEFDAEMKDESSQKKLSSVAFQTRGRGRSASARRRSSSLSKSPSRRLADSNPPVLSRLLPFPLDASDASDPPKSSKSKKKRKQTRDSQDSISMSESGSPPPKGDPRSAESEEKDAEKFKVPQVKKTFLPPRRTLRSSSTPNAGGSSTTSSPLLRSETKKEPEMQISPISSSKATAAPSTGEIPKKSDQSKRGGQSESNQKTIHVQLVGIRRNEYPSSTFAVTDTRELFYFSSSEEEEEYQKALHDHEDLEAYERREYEERMRRLQEVAIAPRRRRSQRHSHKFDSIIDQNIFELHVPEEVAEDPEWQAIDLDASPDMGPVTLPVPPVSFRTIPDEEAYSAGNKEITKSFLTRRDQGFLTFSDADAAHSLNQKKEIKLVEEAPQNELGLSETEFHHLLEETARKFFAKFEWTDEESLYLRELLFAMGKDFPVLADHMACTKSSSQIRTHILDLREDPLFSVFFNDYSYGTRRMPTKQRSSISECGDFSAPLPISASTSAPIVPLAFRSQLVSDHSLSPTSESENGSERDDEERSTSSSSEEESESESEFESGKDQKPISTAPSPLPLVSPRGFPLDTEMKILNYMMGSISRSGTPKQSDKMEIVVAPTAAPSDQPMMAVRTTTENGSASLPDLNSVSPPLISENSEPIKIEPTDQQGGASALKKEPSVDLRIELSPTSQKSDSQTTSPPPPTSTTQEAPQEEGESTMEPKKLEFPEKKKSASKSKKKKTSTASAASSSPLPPPTVHLELTTPTTTSKKASSERDSNSQPASASIPVPPTSPKGDGQYPGLPATVVAVPKSWPSAIPDKPWKRKVFQHPDTKKVLSYLGFNFEYYRTVIPVSRRPFVEWRALSLLGCDPPKNRTYPEGSTPPTYAEGTVQQTLGLPPVADGYERKRRLYASAMGLTYHPSKSTGKEERDALEEMRLEVGDQTFAYLVEPGTSITSGILVEGIVAEVLPPQGAATAATSPLSEQQQPDTPTSTKGSKQEKAEKNGGGGGGMAPTAAGSIRVERRVMEKGIPGGWRTFSGIGYKYRILVPGMSPDKGLWVSHDRVVESIQVGNQIFSYVPGDKEESRQAPLIFGTTPAPPSRKDLLDVDKKKEEKSATATTTSATTHSAEGGASASESGSQQKTEDSTAPATTATAPKKSSKSSAKKAINSGAPTSDSNSKNVQNQETPTPNTRKRTRGSLAIAAAAAAVDSDSQEGGSAKSSAKNGQQQQPKQKKQKRDKRGRKKMQKSRKIRVVVAEKVSKEFRSAANFLMHSARISPFIEAYKTAATSSQPKPLPQKKDLERFLNHLEKYPLLEDPIDENALIYSQKCSSLFLCGIRFDLSASCSFTYVSRHFEIIVEAVCALVDESYQVAKENFSEHEAFFLADNPVYSHFFSNVKPTTNSGSSSSAAAPPPLPPLTPPPARRTGSPTSGPIRSDSANQDIGMSISGDGSAPESENNAQNPQETEMEAEWEEEEFLELSSGDEGEGWGLFGRGKGTLSELRPKLKRRSMGVEAEQKRKDVVVWKLRLVHRELSIELAHLLQQKCDEVHKTLQLAIINAEDEEQAAAAFLRQAKRLKKFREHATKAAHKVFCNFYEKMLCSL